MKIAFVSYEYPPDTALGGIATYARQAATLLAGRGHLVEVFAASHQRCGHFNYDNVGVNLVVETNRLEFAHSVLKAFSERHALHQFDVIESPEFFADGREIRKAYPHLAHVVKLHTPIALVQASNASRSPFLDWALHQVNQARAIGGALRRGRLPPFYRPYCSLCDQHSHLYPIERDYARSCDLVVSPSQALADWAAREWAIAPSRMMIVPHPYLPSERLLRIPISNEGKVVGYMGRLEERKGVADLIEAIPLILRAEPEARFRFVGRSCARPGRTEQFDAYALRRLKGVRNAIEMVGPCPPDQMPEQYGAVDVCVFPSIWEGFGYVCLEAMAAGRAIVASSAGAMADILEGGAHGLLIPPRHPKAIAEAVVRLLRSPDLRHQLGASARKRVLDAYNGEKIGPELERSFAAAIALSRAGRPD